MPSPEPPPLPPSVPMRSPAARLPVRVRLMTLGIAAALYIAACALRAMSLDNGDHWSGFQVAWMGWMGIFFGQLAWFAHLPAMAAAVTLLIGLRRTTMVLASLAVLIGTHMLAFPGTLVMLDEGGVNKATIISLGPAAWLWLAALFTPAAGVFIGPSR